MPVEPFLKPAATNKYESQVNERSTKKLKTKYALGLNVVNVLDAGRSLPQLLDDVCDV